VLLDFALGAFAGEDLRRRLVVGEAVGEALGEALRAALGEALAFGETLGTLEEDALEEVLVVAALEEFLVVEALAEVLVVDALVEALAVEALVGDTLVADALIAFSFLLAFCCSFRTRSR